MEKSQKHGDKVILVSDSAVGSSYTPLVQGLPERQELSRHQFRENRRRCVELIHVP